VSSFGEDAQGRIYALSLSSPYTGWPLGRKIHSVSPRARIKAYGAAAACVLAGVVCAVFVHGLIGQLLTIVLFSVGLGGALLLVFLEVGLSEDRDREREEQRRRERDKPHRPTRPKPQPWRRPRRPG
jgi:hypothetical protein